MHIEERKLDIAKQDARHGQIKPIVLRRGEIGQTQIKITIVENEKPYDIGNLTPRFCAVLPDLKFVRDTAHVTHSANVITYTVQSDLTSAAGDIRIAYIELLSENNSITSDSIPIIVLENVELSEEDAKKYQNDIDAMLKKLQEQKELVDSQEQARVEAENTRVTQEQTRQSQESTRQSAEGEREKTFTESQSARDQAFEDAETERDATVDAAAKKATDAASKADTSSANADAAEKARADAEAKRVTAEQGRVTAEQGRVTAESGRVAAESSRVAAEKERESAQDANDQAQAKNNADQVKNNSDQAANNAAARGMIVVYPEKWDKQTLQPIVDIPELNKYYMVPRPDSAPEDLDRYVDWLWTGEKWERVGSSGATIDPITTDDIDAVVAGESPQGTRALMLFTLPYLWTQIKNVGTSAENNVKTWVANTAKAASAKLADVATKLGTATVGSATEPIYLNLGVPTVISKVGAASTADVATKLGNDTVGSTTSPIYLNKGVPTVISKVGAASTADTATKLGAVTVGSATEPIYLNQGAPAKITKVGSAAAADSAATLSATLSVAKGGTGATTLTANQVLLGNGTGAVTSTAANGTGVLQRSSATGAPTFATVPTAMIADRAVTSAKIADGTIVAADLNAALLKRITDLETAWDSLPQFYYKNISVGGGGDHFSLNTTQLGLATLEGWSFVITNDNNQAGINIDKVYVSHDRLVVYYSPTYSGSLRVYVAGIKV